MDAPHLRVVKPEATPEEVAAITAAVATVLEERREAAARSTRSLPSEWVHAARLGARRAGMSRGPWRLSGRLARRARA